MCSSKDKYQTSEGLQVSVSCRVDASPPYIDILTLMGLQITLKVEEGCIHFLQILTTDEVLKDCPIHHFLTAKNECKPPLLLDI